jgi:hypothetical protein
MTSGDSSPEPVRRYLAHAVPSGETGAPGVRLTMSGRIKVGIWLPFSATQRLRREVVSLAGVGRPRSAPPTHGDRSL